ncbi:MAG: glycosyltransferase [Pseudomonadota bacterium]
MALGDRDDGQKQTAVFEAIGTVEAEFAANALSDRAPLLSSRRHIGRLDWLKWVVATGLIVSFVMPLVMFMTLSTIFLGLFFIAIICRGTLILMAGVQALRLKRTRSTFPQYRSWPYYTVLVPLFEEASCVPALVRSLMQFDYPIENLQVIFLTEEADHETRQALRRQMLSSNWSVLMLPDGHPRTKPRALNVGLRRARGEYITVYDAEDRPHPKQLKSAVIAFETGSDDLACVQAPLRAHNAASSWVAGHWSLEYDIYFGLVLPGLARSGLPIAVGGTSNHFRASVLKACGAWDAWNVTEDADLGLRLARLGWRISTIRPQTQEEAPETIGVWISQRSRWIKGHMQSWAVLMTDPLYAIRELGFRQYLSVQLLFGGAVLSACLHAPLLLWCLVNLTIPNVGVGPESLMVIGLGYLVSAIGAFAAPGRTKHRWLLVMTLPLYWPLLTLAALRATIELFNSPYSWAKTPHGLTSHAPSLDPAAYF